MSAPAPLDARTELAARFVESLLPYMAGVEGSSYSDAVPEAIALADALLAATAPPEQRATEEAQADLNAHPQYVRGYENGWKAAQERYSADTHAEPTEGAEAGADEMAAGCPSSQSEPPFYECELPVGHAGDHEATTVEATWPAPPARSVQPPSQATGAQEAVTLWLTDDGAGLELWTEKPRRAAKSAVWINDDEQDAPLPDCAATDALRTLLGSRTRCTLRVTVVEDGAIERGEGDTTK